MNKNFIKKIIKANVYAAALIGFLSLLNYLTPLDIVIAEMIPIIIFIDLYILRLDVAEMKEQKKDI